MDFKSPRMRLVLVFVLLSWLLLYNFYFQRKAARTIPAKNVIYASPSGGTVTERKKHYQTIPLAEALNRVPPGHTVFLFPGEYQGPLSFEKTASESAPISISGLSATLIGSPSGEYCLRLKEAQWIFIDGLILKNCGKHSIEIADSENIYIHENEFTGSQSALFVHGKESRNIVIEANRLLNGGTFFASSDTAGDVVIRKNEIDGAEKGAVLEGDSLNIQVYENKFSRMRGPVFTASGNVSNAWIHHNQIAEAPLIFSLERFTGGYFYIFGNTAKNGEAVFRFSKEELFPTQPLYIFHNTWRFQEDYIAPGTVTRHLRHFNNILLAESQTPRILSARTWHETYQFDYDLTNFSKPAFMEEKNLWQNGLQADPLLASLEQGDFSLGKGSPAIDRGVSLKFSGWASEYYGDAPDIGAFEGKFPVKGPPFQRR